MERWFIVSVKFSFSSKQNTLYLDLNLVAYKVRIINIIIIISLSSAQEGCTGKNLVAYKVRLEDGELEAPQFLNDHLGNSEDEQN